MLFPKSVSKFSPALTNYITDSNKTFWSRSRGNLIDSDPDSDSRLVATTPGDSDSDSAPLVKILRTLWWCRIGYFVSLVVPAPTPQAPPVATPLQKQSTIRLHIRCWQYWARKSFSLIQNPSCVLYGMIFAKHDPGFQRRSLSCRTVSGLQDAPG